jgi:hypothetical protein
MKLKVVNHTSLDAKWNRRFFRVTDEYVMYYRDESSTNPAGWLRLSQVASVQPVATDAKIPGAAVTPPFAFKVQLTTRTLYLQAKSAEEVT